MAKPRKSHSERYDEYKELIESGKSISEIAKALDIKPQAVYFYLGSHEELPRPRGYVPQLERTINLDSNKKRELSRLVSQDYTRREIAGIMGMSYHGLGSYWDRKPKLPRSRIIFNPQKYRTIKRLLQRQAKQKRLNQSEIARELGTTQSNISSWIRNHEELKEIWDKRWENRK